MAGNNHQHDAPPSGATHEEKDVNALAVGLFGVCLAVLCIVAVILLIGLFRYFQNQEAARQVPTEVAAPAAGMRGLPAEPKLQEHPREDLKQMRAEEDQILGSYGWVDHEKGIVRLPIGRAMELLAQRNPPFRQGPAPDSAASGVSVPTESGLGPKMIPPGGPLAVETQGK
jgi:hypothetical protein